MGKYIDIIIVILYLGILIVNKRFRTECAQFSSLTLSVSTLNLQSFLVSTSTNTKKNSIPSNQEKWNLKGQFSLDYSEVTTPLFWGCFLYYMLLFIFLLWLLFFCCLVVPGKSSINTSWCCHYCCCCVQPNYSVEVVLCWVILGVVTILRR